MFKQTSPPPLYSESEWWLRLASFATPPEAQGSPQYQPERLTIVDGKSEFRGRGFRVITWQPLYLLILAYGQRFLRVIQERKLHPTLQSPVDLFGRRDF